MTILTHITHNNSIFLAPIICGSLKVHSRLQQLGFDGGKGKTYQGGK